MLSDGQGQASFREGQGSPGSQKTCLHGKQGLDGWVWAVVRVQGWVVPWLDPRDACSSSGMQITMEDMACPVPNPGLCLLGITVSVTKSLLSCWQGARLSSSR